MTTNCGLTMAPLHQHQNNAMSNEQNDKQSTEDGGADGNPAVRCWACIYADKVSVLGVDGKWRKTRTAHCMAEGSWANGEEFYRKVYVDTLPPSCVHFTPCT